MSNVTEVLKKFIKWQYKLVAKYRQLNELYMEVRTVLTLSGPRHPDAVSFSAQSCVITTCCVHNSSSPSHCNMSPVLGYWDVRGVSTLVQLCACINFFHLQKKHICGVVPRQIYRMFRII